MTTTCQICGREIKAKNGRIAHHGYSRPLPGLQTSSCYGARALPYEESRERLRRYIDLLAKVLDRKAEILIEIESDPVAVLRVKDCRASAQRGSIVMKDVGPDHPHYPTIRKNHLTMLRSDLTAVQRERDYMMTRYAEW